MVSRKNYNAQQVEAARSVLIELTHLLAEYRDEIVLIGGWVPALSLPGGQEAHVGSIDVDLALDHRKLSEEGNKTISELLASKGYKQGEQPFIFFRTVDMEGTPVTVEVDLLAGEYEGTGPGHRTQPVQDVRARKARGCDLAFSNPAIIHVSGTLPGGGIDSVDVRVSAIVPFMIMKAMAMDTRLKEKDAWDIDFCLSHFPGGVDRLAGMFQHHLFHGLIQEGLKILAQKFETVEHVGPRHVADFEEIADPEERAIRQRAAFERVQALLRALKGTTRERES
jgi:hypothetical protein